MDPGHIAGELAKFGENSRQCLIEVYRSGGSILRRRHRLSALGKKDGQSKQRNCWHLVVCNPPEALEQMIQSDSVFEKKCTIVPHLIGDDKLRCFYSALDIFVHIADNGESFGMAITESLLCETPVVTLNTPWLHNSQGGVVGDGVGGLCANSLSEVYDSVTGLAQDHEARRRLGRQGRVRASSVSRPAR